MSAPPDRHGAQPDARGYEVRDVRTGPLAAWIAALIALMLAASLFARGFSAALERRAAQREEAPHPMAPSRRMPRAALLQADPVLELEAYQAAQREVLSSYGWVDPQEDVVRLPIERAMELLAERGLPARAAAEEEGER